MKKNETTKQNSIFFILREFGRSLREFKRFA